MASEEEARIIISTVGQTQGAQEVTNALRQTQQTAQQTQQSVNTFADAANRMLQTRLTAQGATAANFERAVRQIQQRFGVAPTLTPADFGITDKVISDAKDKAFQVSKAFAEVMKSARPAPAESPFGSIQEFFPLDPLKQQREQDRATREALLHERLDVLRQSAEDPAAQVRLFAARGAQQQKFDQLLAERARTASKGGEVVTEGMPAEAVARFEAATRAINGTTAATKELVSASQASTNNLIRLGASLVGFGVGLSLFSAAGRLAHDSITAIINDALELERVFRQNTVVFGEQAQAFQSWASTVADQVGVTQQTLLQAGTSAQQLARAVGFDESETRGLVAVAAVVARLQGTTNVGQTMEQLAAAIRGNEQAAQGLGLQLDAAFIAYTQLGGAVAEVFQGLDPATQATLRAASATEQVARQAGNAAPHLSELAKASGSLQRSWETLVTQTGPGLLTVLAGVLDGAVKAIAALDALDRQQQARAREQGRPTHIDDSVAQAFSQTFAQTNDAIAEQRARLRQGVGEFFDSQRKQLVDAKDAAGEAFNQLGTRVTSEARRSTDFGRQSVLNQPEVLAATQPALDAGRQQALQGLRETQAAVAGVAASVTDTLGAAFDSAGSIVADWADRARDALSRAAGSATQVATATGAIATQAGQAADREDRIAAALERQRRLAATAQAVSAQLPNLSAARQNEIEAQKALTDLKFQQVQLAGQEAEIRLSMLPQQQQQLQLQNALVQAQIRANQQTLPTSRGLEDLQSAIERNRLIAQSGNRPLAERSRAAEVGAGLVRQLPDAQLAALDQRLAVRPLERRIEDVNNEVRLQQAQQQEQLFPAEFANQQLALLSQVATAAKTAAERTVELAVDAINVIVGGAGELTEVDYAHISELTGKAVVDAIHQAVQSQSRQAAPQLAGAGTP